MKLNNIIWLCILIVTACSSPLTESNESEYTIPDSNRQAKFKIGFQTDGFSLRARGDLKNHPIEIHNITFYLFKPFKTEIGGVAKEGVTLVHTIPLTAEQIQSSSFQGSLIIEDGSYLVVAVANTPGSPSGPDIWNTDQDNNLYKEDGITFHGLFQWSELPFSQQSLNLNQPILTSSNCNVMHDKQDISIDNQLKQGYGPSYLTFDSSTPNVIAEATVFLDRYHSAVCVVDAPEGIVAKHPLALKKEVKLRVSGFAILNIPHKSYIIEQRSLTDPNQLRTPQMTESPENTKWSYTLSHYLDYSSESKGYAEGITAQSFTLAPQYLLENSLANSDICGYYGYSTAIIIQIKADSTFYAIRKPDKPITYLSHDKPNDVSDEDTYNDGIMYYTYYLHSQGAYQVKRNTWYELVVKSLSDVGTHYPGEDIPNPTNPDEEISKEEEELTYIQINLEIKPIEEVLYELEF